MYGCGGRESQVLADMGGSAEEKGRTGRTWFDRIWDPLLAVKDASPLVGQSTPILPVECVRYISVLTTWGSTVLQYHGDVFAQYSTVYLLCCSPSWELGVFIITICNLSHPLAVTP